MTVLLGIDLGTSSVKAMLFDVESARVVATAAREVPLHTPRPGWAEQHPADWWAAAVGATRAALAAAAIAPESVRAIGLSGQMHGTVLLDAAGEPVRPAIIWADTRSGPQADAIRAAATPAGLAQHAPGPPVAGFMGVTLAWLAAHEPESLARTAVALTPKDALRLRLTGEVATEPTDASATWLFDVAAGKWSPWLAERCRVDLSLLPPVRHSAAVAGALWPAAASALGLRAGVPVVYGLADQPAQALGCGLPASGTALVTVGTGGQVLLPLDAPQVDAALRLHTFSHAEPGRWYALAAILAAGLSLRWLRDTLGMQHQPDAYAHLSALAAETPPGADGLLFLPHLAGERTPYMDAALSGAFVGLRLQHGPGHIARAVMEGVALALAECVTVASSLGEPPARVLLSGGGAASPVWRQIIADAVGVPLALVPGSDHAPLGAALLAGVGAGLFASLDEARAALPSPTEHVSPGPAAVLYAERRAQAASLLAALREPMHTLAAESDATPPSAS